MGYCGLGYASLGKWAISGSWFTCDWAIPVYKHLGFSPGDSGHVRQGNLPSGYIVVADPRICRCQKGGLKMELKLGIILGEKGAQSSRLPYAACIIHSSSVPTTGQIHTHIMGRL